MTKVAAVDIGASSGRVLLASLTDGVPELVELHRFRNGPEPAGHRWIWPFERIRDEVIAGLGRAHEQGARHFGVDTWAIDYSVIDEDGQWVGPVFAYRDPHHERGIPIVRGRLSWADQYRYSGIQDMPINTIYQVMSEDPSRVEPGNRLLLVPDALRYALTGDVGTEVTNASSTALVDPRTRQWSSDIVQALGIPPGFLGDIHEPGVLGSECHALPGLRYVSVATHDTGSAFAGTPIEDRDSCLIVSLGTWALVGYEADSAEPTPQTEAINLTHELGVEKTVRCLRNVTGMWLFEECRRWWEAHDGESPSVADLLDEAERSPASLSIVDVDLPELSAPGLDPATIVATAVGAKPADRGQLIRLILESLIVKLALQVQQIERVSGRSRDRIHVVGGGSRIGFLMQWLADATGKTVVAGPTEAASLGNAMVQWVTLGEFANMTEARSAIANSPSIRVFHPGTTRARWQELAGLLDWTIG